jgi:hypothetical protein
MRTFYITHGVMTTKAAGTLLDFLIRNRPLPVEGEEKSRCLT